MLKLIDLKLINNLNHHPRKYQYLKHLIRNQPGKNYFKGFLGKDLSNQVDILTIYSRCPPVWVVKDQFKAVVEQKVEDFIILKTQVWQIKPIFLIQ